MDNKAILLLQWDKLSSTVSEDPAYPYGYVVVEDNGEGSKATPDRISLHHMDDTLEDCGILFNVPLYDIEAGNVQIHKSK